MTNTVSSSLLEDSRILPLLSASSRPLLSELCLHGVIDSTNAEAIRRITAGAKSGLVCVAEQQTAGRGRRGRDWISPYASNLYLSLVWEFARGAAALEGLSLAVGVTVTEALARCAVTDLKLKWPNDILHEGSKLGGILIEMVGDATGSCKAVIGIGINVNMPESAVGAIDQNWTDISRITPATPDRNELLAALLEEVLPMLPAFEQKGFAAWRERWSERDAFAGCPVVVHSGPRQVAGIAQGVNDSGALLLGVGDEVQEIHGGEVSLRLDS
jgi:BirA family biotin operon repressor/biotin-[acetyl-CoA-carboxylase] ligase